MPTKGGGLTISKTLTTIEGNCGGVTLNWWKTLTTIEVNHGGLTSN